MTSDTFITWLRGFLAAVGDAGLTPEQTKCVRDEFAKVKTVAADIDWSKFFPTPIYPTQPTIPDPLPYPLPYPQTTIAYPPSTKIWFDGNTSQAVGPEWVVPVTFTTAQENKQ